MRAWGVRSKVPALVNQQASNRRQHFFLHATPGGPMFSPYTWKGSPYQGMVKRGRAGHSTFQTYRVVSSKSPADSWIHPGQAPNPVILAVRNHVASEVVEAVRTAVHEFAETHRTCAVCGGSLREMTHQTEDAEAVTVVERRFVLLHHVRKKYRCRSAGCVETAAGWVTSPTATG